MNNQFDELAKAMAQSVTRRGALKKFGAGLAGALLACLGLADKAQAQAAGHTCNAWHCANCCGDWYAYVCGNRKPKCGSPIPGGPCSCQLIGPVDCSYCDQRCC